MAISSDMLIERVRMRRQISFWRLATIGAIVFFIVMLVETPNVNVGKNYIARVKIDGIITDDTDQQKMLADLRDNDNVKAVILSLNTPGGTAVGGEELYKLIHQIRKKKPVVATMRSLCASAGYMTAMAADHVLAMEGTITGSVGVIFQTAEITGLAEKFGVTPIVVKSGPLKGAPNLLEKTQPEDRAMLQGLVDSFHTSFRRMVEESRQLPPETMAQLADGRIFSGVQAVDLKLADALGGEQEALDWLHKEKGIDTSLEVKDAEVKKKNTSFLSRLTESAGFTLPAALSTLKLDGLLLIWQPAAQ